MFFWHVLIRLMCFYLHILQLSILSFYFRPWLPNKFTHFLGGHICQNNVLFTEFLLQRHCSSHRTCCTVIIIFKLHRINNDLHLHTETVKQNGAITYITCQYYLPVFITSLLRNKVLLLRTWVGDPQLWAQNSKKTYRSCKKRWVFLPTGCHLLGV